MVTHLGVRHAAVPVRDLDRSLAFYHDALGFLSYYVASRDWAMLKAAGTTLSLIPAETWPTMPAGGSHPQHLGLVVAGRAEVDALHAKLAGWDIKRWSPKAHRDGSYGFYFLDPDGNQWEVIDIPYRPHTESITTPVDRAMVLLVPDSPAGRAMGEQIRQRVCRHMTDKPVVLATLTGDPGLSPVLDELVSTWQPQAVTIVPLLLTDGPETAGLSQELEAVRRRLPAVTIDLAPAIGELTVVQESIAMAAIEQSGL